MKIRKLALLLVLLTQFLPFELQAENIVCLHGFLDCSKSFKKIRTALVYHGFEVSIWEYPSRKKYIQEHGADLVPLLQHIASQCPREPIHFVAHSIGGLVVRAALNHPCCPLEARIGKAILLAPPSQGSSLARRFRNFFPISLIMGKKSGWELMNYTPEQINCYGNFPPSMEVLVVAGTKGNGLWFKEKNDGYLTVQETWLNSPFFFLEYPTSHGDILKNPIIMRNVVDFLKSGPDSISLSPI